MGREFQESFPPLAELAEKAALFEKLSAERAALAKRVGIAGKVKAIPPLKPPKGSGE